MYSVDLSASTLATCCLKPDAGKTGRKNIVTVLIVEDDGAMRELIKKVIGDLADSFCECSDGRDALALYEKHHPAWVLMDIRMEHMDGLSATQQITTAWPSACVVVVTAYIDEDLREAAFRAGARGFVSKENLLEIRELLARS